MKRIIALVLITVLLFSLSCCGNKQEETAPYFKGVKWGDSIETVKEIEKKADKVVTEENEEIILTCKDTYIPYWGIDGDVEYKFEDGKLKSLSSSFYTLTDDTEKTAKKCTENINKWLDKHFYYHKSWDEENAKIYVANDDNTTTVTVQDTGAVINVILLYFPKGVQ